ncbi:hemoglobin [Seinonella peptonophila]|uniref:Hemoglobin n=1 Tax=Seinonella peptonophila TaxID=112248 RepID=A0A1M4ZJ60_9BACL|nr:globin [Seinonella peptonophila]SHF18031.1 hemoglobin [Seinonella peptonophila]
MLSPYEQIGGEKTVRAIVEKFYAKVQQHPLLAPLFPEDIQPVMERQYLFLTQFLGGEPLYTQKRGQPMLRARHLPFPITKKHAEAWLLCMHEALDEVGITGMVRNQIWSRLEMTAFHMVNQSDE